MKKPKTKPTTRGKETNDVMIKSSNRGEETENKARNEGKETDDVTIKSSN